MQYQLPSYIDPDNSWLTTQFVALDTETTGVTEKDRIVEIAMVLLDVDGSVLSEWQTLVNPEVSIPKKATKIHKITDAMVKPAPTFDQVLPIVSTYLDGRIPVAYNFSFDHRMLCQDYARTSSEPAPEFFGVDPMVLGRYFFKDVPGGHSEENLSKHLGVHGGDEDHRALPDTLRMCRLFFEHIQPKIKKSVTYSQFWDRQVGLALQHEKRIKISKGANASTPWHDNVTKIEEE